MANKAKVQQGEQLFDELTIVVKTSLPSKTDEEVNSRYEEVQDLIARLETLLDHWFGPGGDFHNPGYSLTLERR